MSISHHSQLLTVSATIVVATSLIAVLTACGRDTHTQVSSKSLSSIQNLDKSSDTLVEPRESITTLEDGLKLAQTKNDTSFATFLAQGGARSDDDVLAFLSRHFSISGSGTRNLAGHFACSTLATQSPSGDQLFGRNFDWDSHTQALILVNTPQKGWRSVSTVNLGFLTMAFGDSFDHLPAALIQSAALYAPLDGMNEKGLVVSVNMIEDSASINQNTGKTGVTTTTAIRMLLDQATDVGSAVDLLKQYDLHSSQGLMVHFAISDASGKAVDIEYIDNQMQVIPTPILTNYYLASGPRQGIGSEESHRRYDHLKVQLQTHQQLDTAGVAKLLEAVSKHHYQPSESTEWSIVYNQTTRSARYYHREQFDHSYTLSLS